MHPFILDVLLACMQEYGIRWVRLVDEDGIARHRSAGAGSEVVCAIFGLLARRGREGARRARVGATDRVYGLRASGRLSAEEILWLLPRITAPNVELYGHPDLGTEQGRREASAFRSPAVREAVRAAGFRLVNSRALGRGEAVAA
jgi:hypothetical protein